MSFGEQWHDKSQSRDQRNGNAVLSDLTDSELISQFRKGNSTSYGTLWERHYRGALRMAQAATSRVDAEDIVSESFTNIMDVMLRGKGPDLAFRPYLMATVRNVAVAMGKNAAGYVELDDAETDQLVDPASSDEAALQALESSILNRGFRTLPQHWQEVLWYSDVEGFPAKETARLMGGGMNAASVASLAYRAREGLRQAWIREHLAQSPSRGECAWVVERIPAYKRGKGRTAEQRRVREHIENCAFCTMAMVEAKEASRRFMAGVAVVLIGFVVPGGGPGGATGATLPSAAALLSVDMSVPGASNTSARSAITHAVRSITSALRFVHFGISIGKAFVGVLVVGAIFVAAAFGADSITHVLSMVASPSGGSRPSAPTGGPGPQGPFVNSSVPGSKAKADVLTGTPSNVEPGPEIRPVPKTPHPDDVLSVGTAPAGQLESRALPSAVQPAVRTPISASAGHPEAGTNLPNSGSASAPDTAVPKPVTLTAPGSATIGENKRGFPKPVHDPTVAEPADPPNKGKGQPESKQPGDHAPAGPVESVVPVVLAAPTVTSVDTGSGLFYPVIAGTGNPSARVTVSGPDGQSVQTVVAADGIFRAPALTGLPVGSSVVLVTQKVGGATSKPVVVHVDLRGVTITGTKQSGNEVQIRFTEAAGTVVELRDPHGSEPVRRTANGGGLGLLKVPALWHSAEVVAMDPDGRTGPVTTVSF
ncbi:hypothetical protein [Arthrobacter bambusae]|uniref:RNA polymerase sigma factor (Sigma-70 family) n=1 Tax=Arthrobacter bambusae TaxID=1338426 RepID=A0AAW8DDS2_9MICC|nr:hypothetical protein [Arthrobacter bambusae]MDP9903224.1 RNA polymerase sigma factor (sigma-70 family) [Arthrobacter bambusae]MDQ0128782.1 RNA polymerase sigma factor (sigma-70 family) [Arthrobacter bambusae]MDQ0180123.1 RNA polymerase sigma factor (sigma-70 family) [Arthrobacter bambusae]